LTTRRDYKPALAVAGPNRPADKLNALQDAASPVSGHYPQRPQFPNNTCAGNIIDAGPGRVTKSRSHPPLAAWRAALYFLSVHINRRPAANILIEHPNNAILVNLNPQAHKGIDKAEIERPVHG